MLIILRELFLRIHFFVGSFFAGLFFGANFLWIHFLMDLFLVDSFFTIPIKKSLISCVIKPVHSRFVHVKYKRASILFNL